MYPTLTCADFHSSIAMDLLILSVHLFGLSSSINAINMISTILVAHVRGSSLKRHLGLFNWSLLLTSLLLIVILPVLSAGVTMILVDRNLNSCFFDVLGGGDTVIYQHIF